MAPPVVFQTAVHALKQSPGGAAMGRNKDGPVLKVRVTDQFPEEVPGSLDDIRKAFAALRAGIPLRMFKEQAEGILRIRFFLWTDPCSL